MKVLLTVRQGPDTFTMRVPVGDGKRTFKWLGK